MSIFSDIIEVGSFGLIDDPFGEEAAADAAREAGNIQAEASLAGVEEIGRQFDVTQETLRPAIEAGDTAREQQLALLGLRGNAAQTAAINNIQESPAQKFIRERAQRNLVQNAAAIGGTGGGNVKTALVEQGAGFAAQDIENQFGRLQQITAPGTQTAVNQSQFGARAAEGIAAGTNRAAEARASGILGAAQANQFGIQQGTQLLTTGALLSASGGSSAPALT